MRSACCSLLRWCRFCEYGHWFCTESCSDTMTTANYPLPEGGCAPVETNAGLQVGGGFPPLFTLVCRRALPQALVLLIIACARLLITGRTTRLMPVTGPPHGPIIDNLSTSLICSCRGAGGTGPACHGVCPVTRATQSPARRCVRRFVFQATQWGSRRVCRCRASGGSGGI